MLRNQWQMTVYNLEDFNPQIVIPWALYDVVLLITSTHGSGAAPDAANRQARIAHNLQT